MSAAEIELSTADGDMATYEATPEQPGAPRGAVIVLQEAFGVNEHIEDVVRRFAARGYHSVAPHLFHRTGGGTLPYDDLGRVFEHLSGLTDAGLLTDVDAAMSHLREAGFPPEAIGTVGFCMGGRAAFLVAAERSLGAAVTFYGGRIVTGYGERLAALLPRAARLRTPWLGLFGDLDKSIPVEEVEAIRAAVERAPVPASIVRYPEAGHGFHCDARPEYHPMSASDAWGRTLDWLECHLSR